MQDCITNLYGEYTVKVSLIRQPTGRGFVIILFVCTVSLHIAIT